MSFRSTHQTKLGRYYLLSFHPSFTLLDRSLQKYGQLPENAKINEGDAAGDDADGAGVEFAEGSDSEESEDDLDDL